MVYVLICMLFDICSLRMCADPLLPSYTREVLVVLVGVMMTSGIMTSFERVL